MASIFMCESYTLKTLIIHSIWLLKKGSQAKKPRQIHNKYVYLDKVVKILWRKTSKSKREEEGENFSKFYGFEKFS